MVTGTVLKCGREAETHGGPLRKVGDGWVCQQCYDKEHGIERKEAKGKPVLCPKCGEVLMTRFRGGRVNIGNMSMKGSTATLNCDCGYKKVVQNPFGGTRNRDELARQRLRSKSSGQKAREKK